ncbi:MAG TPA: hypothetical protein VKF63_01335 [Terracidiphilus sp.]|nr:hypothetical protein [Terracidiphilus sp.]
MTADNYLTIFELGPRSFPWPIHLYILLIIGVLLIKIKYFRNNKYFFIAGIFATSMASIFILVSLMAFIPEYIKLQNEYVSGKSVVVEGVVQNFRPAPALGPATESFSVNEVSFSYYAAADTPCFTNAPFRKGPIRDGLNVRIHYYKNCIQRVEVLHKADSTLYIPNHKDG